MATGPDADPAQLRRALQADGTRTSGPRGRPRSGRHWRLLIALCLAGGILATAGAAAPSDLLQKPGAAGCVSFTVPGPCTAGNALDGASSVTVSPDGRSAYVASFEADAVAVFDRAVDGALTQKPGSAGCVAETIGTCLDGTALDGASSVTVSPDGRSAYVASVLSDAVAVFDRTADGTLVQKPGLARCISESGSGGACTVGSALDGAASVTVSPDGRSAYVASVLSDAVAVFDRTADGTLVQKPVPAACVSELGAGPCTDGSALDGAASVIVSPDGRNAYVASQDSDSVAVLGRAADGTLTQSTSTAGCVSESGSGGACADGTALDRAFSVTVSPDGRNAYVASIVSDAVAVFDRAADGGLAQRPGAAGCVSETGSGGACADGTALDSADSLALSPDGGSAYVASQDSDAVAIFARAADGTLAQSPGPAGCISENGSGGACADGTALDRAVSVAVSADGRSAYVASFDSDAVAVFDRPQPGSATPGRAGPTPGPRAAPRRATCKGARATIVATRALTRGTLGRDVIVGRPGRDLIRALGGRDLVCGRGGNDALIGGPGADRLFGEAGTDRLSGGAGGDLLNGGPGRDRLGGGPGRDLLRGGPGRDLLRGGPGRDRERQ